MKRIFILFFSLLLFFTATINVYASELDEIVPDIDSNTVTEVTNDEEEEKEEVEEVEEDLVEEEQQKKQEPVEEKGEEEQQEETKEQTTYDATTDETTQEEKIETPLRASPSASSSSEEESEEELEEENNDLEQPMLMGEANQESDSNYSDDDIHGGVVYDIQKAKVIVTKVDENGDPLEGAVLQIIDSKNVVIAEWNTSNDNPYEIQLPDGTYTVHEKSAPPGYEVAEDETIIIKVEIAELDAGAEFVDFPCPDYGGTAMYYVEIKGERYEVYCINQGWETPDANSHYDGELLNSTTIRDYTMQTTPVDISSADIKDAILSDGPIDVSEPSLVNDIDLYNKILDIIYHRHTAKKELGKRGLTYTEDEIRFITEVALKNYTNPGLATLQWNVDVTDELIDAFDAAGVVYKRYTNNNSRAENPNGSKVSYLKHNYRDYVYLPDAPLHSDIVKVDYGKGDAFGQMVAGHFNYFTRYLTDENGQYVLDENNHRITVISHDAKNDPEQRAQVARYYELYLYLISNENPHPDDMHLYIYSSESIPQGRLSSDNFDGKYQNLLGITGYYEEVDQETIDVEMEDKYSTETTEVTVKKVWEDDDNHDGLRPVSITVKLSNGGVFPLDVDTVVLNEENGWEATISGLPKYHEGVEIEYTWSEPKVTGYTSAKTVNNTTTTFTNTHKSEYITVKVQKEWYDTDNERKERPESVVITLLADEEEVASYEFKASENWYHEFINLPKYKDGKEITYSVIEKEVPGKYKVDYAGNYKDILYVYNGLEYGDITPPPDNPPTNDNIEHYVMTFFISSISLVSCAIYLKKYVY